MQKKYETMSTFIEVMQKKTVASFFPDTVYIVKSYQQPQLRMRPTYVVDEVF